MHAAYAWYVVRGILGWVIDLLAFTAVAQYQGGNDLTFDVVEDTDSNISSYVSYTEALAHAAPK